MPVPVVVLYCVRHLLHELDVFDATIKARQALPALEGGE